MKKRVVALLLGVVMVMSTLAGCGAKEETTTKETTESTTKVETSTTTEEATTEDPAAHEFTYEWDEQGESGVPMWNDPWWKQFAGTKLTVAFYKRELDESKVFEDKPIVRDIEKLTGMDLEWIPLDSGSASEKVATMLADPNNMPDVFQGPLGMSDISANPELFADLSAPGMLDTYGRHIQGRIDEVGIQKNLTQVDGTIRSLAANCGEEYGSSMRSLGWINMTWCEKVGKEFPTTWDEFVDVLRAFKTGDPNGNGQADEIPFSFNEANSLGIQNLANCFGISGQANGDYRYWIDPREGIVNSVCDTPEWREFLEVCHELAAEGLLDVEGFSDTYEQYTSKLAMDRVGFFYGWSPSNLQVPNQEDWAAIEPFTYGDYEYSKTSYHHVSFANLSAWAIAATSENKEAALLYIDLLHSSTHWAGAGRQGRVHPDYIVNKANGRLQFGWTAEERTAQFGDLDANIVCYSQGLGENCALLTVLEDGATFETQTLRGEYYLDKDGNPIRMPEPWERNYVWDVYHQYVREGEGIEVLGSKFTSKEATEEKTVIETDLYPYIRTFMADAVINGIDDAKWDGFVDGLEDYGYYKWIDWWQRSYNGEI
jgi:putative aldouronate transport system substrate-binding protein